jgi:hypothetical protein
MIKVSSSVSSLSVSVCTVNSTYVANLCH